MVIKHKFLEHSETLKLKDAKKKPMILSVRVIKDVKRNHSLYEFIRGLKWQSLIQM